MASVVLLMGGQIRDLNIVIYGNGWISTRCCREMAATSNGCRSRCKPVGFESLDVAFSFVLACALAIDRRVKIKADAEVLKIVS